MQNNPKSRILKPLPSNYKYSKHSLDESKMSKLLSEHGNYLHGRNFNAQHMINFINNSPFAKKMESKNINELSSLNDSSIINKSLLNKSNNESGINNSSIFRSQYKIFDNNAPRFLNPSDYLKKDKIDYSKNFSEQSHFFHEKKFIDEPKEFYDKYLKIPKIKYNHKELDYSIINNNDISKGYKEVKSEMLSMKKKQKEFKNLKNCFMDINKKHRVLKSAFRHGILNVDDPFDEKTKLFVKERNFYYYPEIERLKIREKQKIELEKNTITNEDINILNRNPIGDKKLDGRKICQYWKKKNNVNLPFIAHRQNNHERLFGFEGIPKFSSKRANFLREKELNGRKFNVVSSLDNTIILNESIFK